MTRNKELFNFMLLLLILILLTIFITSLFNPMLALMVGVLQVLIFVLNICFYRYRYTQLSKLSQTLRQISHGNYSLEITDNEEGELSILKSELYKLTVRLRESAELLKQEKQYLADALADISHQLKTPLTSLRLSHDLLADPMLDSKTRQLFIAQNKAQLDRLQWLVSSLLKFAKLDTKTAEFKCEPLSVKHLVEQAIEPLVIPLEIKEQQLSIVGEDCSMMGDFHWTVEALTNILKNAIEHTPLGGEIKISYIQNPIYTEIVVQDCGEGIDREDLPYLFKRFYRGKNAHRDSVGIGLALAKSIVCEQQGDLSVESVKGCGTTFRLKFYKLIV